MMNETYETHAKGIRILPGQWRPHYPYEHIAWISPPWPCQDYIWLDFPEAVFADSGLLFLSHVNPRHPVLFPDLPRVAWQTLPGGLRFERKLPNGVRMEGSLTTEDTRALTFDLLIQNGGDIPVRGFKLQTCAYLRGIKEFSDLTNANKFVHQPGAGWQTIDDARTSGVQTGRCRIGFRGGPLSADLPVIVTLSEPAERLVAMTWYGKTYALAANPNHPCMHADPGFPDLEPGQEARIRGALLFFEGTLERFSDWFEERCGRASPGG